MKAVLSSNIPHYHYAAEALEGADLLQRYITGIVPLGRPGVSELLGEELTIARSDSIYEDALAALVTLAQG